MAPPAATAPDSSQPDVDLTVGFDDLIMMLIVFTGVCLAVLATFAVAALYATRLERSEEVDQERPEERVTRLRSLVAPGPPRKHLALPPAGNSVRGLPPHAPAAPSARGYRTVPLTRFVVARLASPASAAPSERVRPAPAAPSARGHRTVPIPRSVVGRLASPAPAAPSARGYYTAPLPRQVLEALKTYTQHCFAGQRAAGHR